jgi:predicted transcriptional regulator
MPSQDTDEAIMGSRLSDAQDRIQELEAEVERLRRQRSECSEDLAHAYDLIKTAIAQLASARRLYEEEKAAPLREDAAINVEIRRLKAVHPEWKHIEKPEDALDWSEDGQDE